MPAQPYKWEQLTDRPPLRWPDGAGVVVSVVISAEHMEWEPPEGVTIPPSAVYGGPYPNKYDPPEVAHHEYGNRVGFFRIAALLDELKIPATVALDSALVRLAPAMLRATLERSWEVAGHGVAFSRMITEDLTEDVERAYIAEALDDLEAATGTRPRGWVGADYGESSRTAELLVAAGVEYVLDWPSDEQPFVIETPAGPILAVPVAGELDDVFSQRVRFVPVQRWGRMVIEGFDRLYADSVSSGRLLVLNVHPFLIGQPFRIRYLREALEHMADHADVSFMTASGVTDAYHAAVAR